MGIRASGGVFVNVDIPGAIQGGEGGIVGGDGSGVFVLESDSRIATRRGDAVRLGRDALIISENLITSDGAGDSVSVVDGVIDNQDSGGLIAGQGAGIRVRAGEPGSGPAGSLSIANEGVIGGEVGIQVDPGNRASQSVVNIGGFGGFISGSEVAINLGAGDDAVENFDTAGIFGDVLLGAGDDALRLGSSSPITGDVLFGPGDDTLRYERSMFQEVMDDFSLFAGGAGFDEATFRGLRPG